jgi:ATP-binding protein involved in chromosome partitioning
MSTQHDAVMRALGTVIEPELHKDLVTLNMIRDLNVTPDGIAHFTIFLTTPACPLKDVMHGAARLAVLKVPGIKEIDVKWDAEVRGRNQGNLNVDIRHVVAVGSGKGGVGKTTVSVNLAVALAMEGARVGLIDADILTPNVPMMLGLTTGRPKVIQNKMIPFETYGIKSISMGYLTESSTPLIMRGPMLHSAIRQFFSDVEWGTLDYMIVDLPPGTGDAVRSLAMFQQLNVSILGVVENMAGDLFGTGGGENLAKARSVPFLGRVPLNAEVRKGGDYGRPIVATEPTSEAAQSFRKIARDVAARISVLQFTTADVIPLNVIN